MLDENLPNFLLAESTDGIKHHSAYYLARGGSDPEPAYSLHHADPSSRASSNCYAAALFDAYNPEVLYGEVLIRPKWTQQAAVSQEELRRNGGIPPPPEPIMPTEFTIQLYNPDLQVEVTRGQGLLGSTHYDFAMPQDTFRTPSGSMLDRTQHDPAASITTPKINFRWKKESKLCKDMTLFVKGKSTDVIQKKKSKEPDIAIAHLKSLKDITIYESNLHRVEIEDIKGLEVVMLLSATVIRDVFYGQLRHVFHISDAEGRRRSSSAAERERRAQLVAGQAEQRLSPPTRISDALHPSSQQTPYQNQQQPITQLYSQSPITDPRTQWEIDAETARLKAQTESEAREQRRQQEAQRRERERLDAEEARRVQRMSEAEEKEQRQRQKEVDRETERLKRIYGTQQQTSPPKIQSAPLVQRPFVQQPSVPRPQQQYPQQVQQPGYPQNWQSYNTRPAAPSHSHSAIPSPSPSPRPYAHHSHSHRPQKSPASYLPAGLNALNLGASMNNMLAPGSGSSGGKLNKKKKKSMWDLGGGGRTRALSESEGPMLVSKRSSVF